LPYCAYCSKQNLLSRQTNKRINAPSQVQRLSESLSKAIKRDLLNNLLSRQTNKRINASSQVQRLSESLSKAIKRDLLNNLSRNHLQT
jgi:hypothetical protein